MDEIWDPEGDRRPNFLGDGLALMETGDVDEIYMVLRLRRNVRLQVDALKKNWHWHPSWHRARQIL